MVFLTWTSGQVVRPLIEAKNKEKDQYGFRTSNGQTRSSVLATVSLRHLWDFRERYFLNRPRKVEDTENLSM